MHCAMFAGIKHQQASREECAGGALHQGPLESRRSAHVPQSPELKRSIILISIVINLFTQTCAKISFNLFFLLLKSMLGRRVLIYIRVLCKLEFTKAQV